MTVNTERITTLDEIITGIPDEYHRLENEVRAGSSYVELGRDQIDQELAGSFPRQYRKKDRYQTVFVALTKSVENEDGVSVPRSVNMKVEGTDGDEVEVGIVAVRKTTTLVDMASAGRGSTQYLGNDGQWYKARDSFS